MYDSTFKEVSVSEFLKNCIDKKIIVYGNSSRIESAITTFLSNNVSYICDSNKENWGKYRDGIEICSPQRLANEDMDKIVVYSVLKDYNVLLSYYKKISLKNFYFDDTEIKPVYFEYFGENGKLSEVQPERKKFKYIDIITDDKFVVPLVNLIEDNFNISEHLIVIHAVNVANLNNRYKLWKFYENKIKDYNNFILIDNECNLMQKNIDNIFDTLLFYMNKCDKIILHNGIWAENMQKFLANNCNILKEKKSDFILWLAELRMKENDNLYKIYSSFNRINADEKNFFALKTKYKINHQVKRIRIGFGYCYYRLDNMSDITHNVTNIFLGKSASMLVNHMEALDYLSRYKNENISIICPLNYGDVIYAKEVKKYGMEIFGNKFHSIDNYIDFENYPLLLNSIDIVVMPLDANCAATTIRLFLQLGKKIYLSNLDNWIEYTKKGYIFYDYEMIKSESFEKFIERNDECTVNKKIAKEEAKYCGAKRAWEEIYNI